jgi:sulfate adenylyltransferase subunit 1 (EFTu-like GTPase family)
LLGIRHVIVAVNKMDLVDYGREALASVRNAFEEFARRLDGDEPCFYFVPISALKGDMVVERGDRMAWYEGPTILELLESIDPLADGALRPFRLTVQLVQKSPEQGRSYLGLIAAGSVSLGQEVIVLPSERTTIVKAIHRWPGTCTTAAAGESIALSLGDELDVSRGDQVASVIQPPRIARSIEATLVGFSVDPVIVNRRYLLKHTSRTVTAKIASVKDVVDVGTLQKRDAVASIGVNDIAHVVLALGQPIFCDPYCEDRATGAFILIDEVSNQTVAAGMIARADAGGLRRDEG